MATSLPIRILVAALSWLTTLLGSGDDMIICALCALLLLLFYLCLFAALVKRRERNYLSCIHKIRLCYKGKSPSKGRALASLLPPSSLALTSNPRRPKLSKAGQVQAKFQVKRPRHQTPSLIPPANSYRRLPTACLA